MNICFYFEKKKQMNTVVRVTQTEENGAYSMLD